MNKNDLIDAIAADADLSKASAGRALDAAIGAITGALAKGGSVSLVGVSNTNEMINFVGSKRNTT